MLKKERGMILKLKYCRKNLEKKILKLNLNFCYIKIFFKYIFYLNLYVYLLDWMTHFRLDILKVF